MIHSRRLTAFSVVVHLGRSVPEAVSEERLFDHRWLAHSLIRTGILPAARPDAAYLSLEQLALTPDRIRDYVRPPDDLPLDAIVILDLADAPYDFLNERFLRNLAALAEDFAAGSERTVLLLLPRHPPATSFLWQGLEDAVHDGPARVVVVDDEGDLRSYGAPSRGTFKTIRDNWPARLGERHGTLEEQFIRKIVARVGHFDLVGQAQETCGRYYFDLSGATVELATLIERWLLGAFSRAQLADSCVTLCGAQSPSMEQALMRAASRVKAAWAVLQSPADDVSRLSRSSNILLFDVINSGATLEAFRSAVPAWGLPVERRAFAALATATVPVLQDPLRVDVVHRVLQQSALRRDCPRCRDGVPMTDPRYPDPYLGIGADAMWWMLDQVAWHPETYGPQAQPKYPYIPALDQVFSLWGDWIAYKYSFLLRDLGQEDLLVVVCPDETAVRGLVQRLSVRYAEQLVAVSIPRGLLDDVAEHPERADEAAADAEVEAEEERQRGVVTGGTRPARAEWPRQLRHLRAIGASVVVIDEFTASGATARGIAALLRAFGVEIAAYLPFLDWDERRPDPTIVTRALYALPNPRPES